MAPAEALREFINERLTSAAVEIFSMFQKTIIRYEKEIYRQERLFEISGTPRVRLRRTESPQSNSSYQKKSSGLEQKEHEVPHIKEEEELVEVTVTVGGSDNSLDSVRDLTTRRLATAAVEIFNIFEQVIIQYEQKIVGQHRLLEIIWKPQIKLHRTELSRHDDCREAQLLKRVEPDIPPIEEDNYEEEEEEEEEESGLQLVKVEQEEEEEEDEEEEPEVIQIKEEQEEPEPPMVEEHRELVTSQRGERHIVQFQSEHFKIPSIGMQSYLGERKQVPDTERLLSHHSEFHHLKKHTDSEALRNAEQRKICMCHSDRTGNFAVSSKQTACGEMGHKKQKLCQKYVLIPERSMSHNLQPGVVLNQQLLYPLIPAAPPPVNTSSSLKRKCVERQNEDRPYIKKPPNAFMLFLKEQRPIVAAELGVRESSIVNAEAGRRWSSLPKEEQAKYFQQARIEAKLHEKKHPGWSSGDNYRRKSVKKSSAKASVPPSKHADNAETLQLFVPLQKPISEAPHASANSRLSHPNLVCPVPFWINPHPTTSQTHPHFHPHLSEDSTHLQ